MLDGILLEKESELAKVNQQLKELEPYKVELKLLESAINLTLNQIIEL